MHEDPTRHMPADPGPPPGEPEGGMPRGAKVAIVMLVALVAGLGVALAVVASDDEGDESEPVTTLPQTTTPATTTTTTEPPTTTTTEPTTTTTTTDEETEPDEGEVVPEPGDDSGGISPY